MSIYLEFPSIAEYPLYPDPRVLEQIYPINEEDMLIQHRKEQQLLQDFLTLKMI